MDNAQIIAKEVTNLFQKIKQLVGIISEGMPSKKDFDAVMDENIDEMIETPAETENTFISEIRYRIFPSAASPAFLSQNG